jgi:hypothetical protein
LTLGDRSIQRDIDDELAFHLAMREEKLRSLGVDPDAARIRAQARFGDQAGVRDQCLTIDRQYAREVRLMEWLESLWTDVRYALRTFRRMPTFTAVAITSSTPSSCDRCRIRARIVSSESSSRIRRRGSIRGG